MKRYTAYDNFAWLYDRDFTDFARAIFPFLKNMAGDRLPDGARVLDVCCGTGQLAKILTDSGYKVTGIDGSRQMLKIARTNAPDARFITADARSFRLPAEYDAVFSTFDALNHIMSLEELQQVFVNVSRCLRKGGIFIFDLNTEYLFENNWKSLQQIREAPDCLYTVQADYKKEERLGEFNCSIFRRKARGWQRTNINLTERYYPPAEVKKALKQSGFKNIREYSITRERGLHIPLRNSLKIFYMAVKR
jgi:SAM-dependent methyltransferase